MSTKRNEGMQLYDFTVPELNTFRELCNFSEDAVYINMKELCREIKEFLQTLYSGTDTPKEREMLKQMIEEVR